MLPTPREFTSAAELRSSAKAVRTYFENLPTWQPPMLTGPEPKPRTAVHVIFIIDDDAYAAMLRRWWTPQENKQKQEPRQVKVEDIQRVVAHYYGVTRHDLISRRRTADVSCPRQVAMYLVKILTIRTLPEIGRLFGDRDHTTVLHAVRKIARKRETDTAFAAELVKLVRQIEGWSNQATEPGET